MRQWALKTWQPSRTFRQGGHTLALTLALYTFFLSFSNPSSSPSLWSFLDPFLSWPLSNAQLPGRWRPCPCFSSGAADALPPPSHLSCLLPATISAHNTERRREKTLQRRTQRANAAIAETMQRALRRSRQPSAHTTQEGALVPKSHLFL